MSEKPDWHQFDLVDAMEEAVFYLSENRQIYFVNTQAEGLTQSNSITLLEQDFLTLFPAKEKNAVSNLIERTLSEGRARMQTEIIVQGTDKLVPVLLRLVRYELPDKGGTTLYALMLDLTELVEALRVQEQLKLANQELENLVVTDPLTSLFNRRYFDSRYAEEMQRVIRYNHPISVLMIDLDHFKLINDEHGHQIGDKVLQHAANCLRSTVRTSDILARYGGEEFILVLPETREEGVLPVAIRIRMRMQTSNIPIENGSIHYTASIGITCYDPIRDGKMDGSDLIRQADDALYRAKEAGRNRVVLHGHPIE